MKRLLPLLLLSLLPLLPLHARSQKTRELSIEISINPAGDAVVHEHWDVDTGDEISEWYLVRKNLDNIRISGFRVYDGEEPLEDDGEWEVDRTREEKAGRYGIVHDADGLELCWGIGEPGDHLFHVRYVMERAVESLHDFDVLRLQVVSPGLASPPEHLRIRIQADQAQLDTASTHFWGFGFKGKSSVEDGAIVFESSEALDPDNYAVVLLRFVKGLFDSPTVLDIDFQEVLDQAMEGAFFGEKKEKDPVGTAIALILTALAMYFLFIRPFVRAFRKAFLKLGFKPKEAPWFRDVPFAGDLQMADYIQSRSKSKPESGGLPLAMILRLVRLGCLGVTREAEGATVLSFTDRNLDQASPAERELYEMLKEASGSDILLQDKEFSEWAKANEEKLYEWSTRMSTEGAEALGNQHFLDLKKFSLTPKGRTEAMHLFGLKNFLSDFTLLDVREAAETTLWQEYMVYGALFGITDRVARQLKDIDPALFKKTFNCDYNDYTSVVAASQTMARTMDSAVRNVASHLGTDVSAVSGTGGSISLGGGGGFHGGGFGGGGR
jgi:hypothetical protein